MGYMADARDAASLTQGYKEARTAILHQAGVEKGVSLGRVLWTIAEGSKTAAFDRSSTSAPRAAGEVARPTNFRRAAGCLPWSR
jgi:hypothetical protein